jgi:hypothetical protein
MQREFTSNDVIALTGITARQLQWWDERGIVAPGRQGHRRIYRWEQLVTVAGHLPASPTGLLSPAHAQSDWFPAAGVRHQPGGHGRCVFGVSPSYRRHSSLSANHGATGRGPAEERPAADVRYMPERRSAAGSSGDSSAQEDCGFGTTSAFAAGSKSINHWT